MKHSLHIWSYWVCFIQILFSINTHLASRSCLEDQRSFLLQLKTNLNYNSSKSSKLVSWNQNLNCCQWNGVYCNSLTGIVIGLDLSGESIIDSIDNLSSLFSLKFLQHLNLANNNFNYNTLIPSGLERLADLTYLNLSNAGFSGQVPIEISKLVKLVTLDLSCSPLLYGPSQLKLENPSLGMVIRNLIDLRELNLSGVKISSNGSEWCKALSSSVPNLQFLSLSQCNLSSEIDASLARLKSLSHISLDGNNLAAIVPDFIFDFKILTSLKLSSCQLNGIFPQKILEIPTLRSLDLSYNKVLQGSFPEFPLNSSLQTLIVSYTGFSGKLPNSINNLIHLQRIELQNCSFSGSIPSSMRRLSQLVHLDFSFNKFSGPIPSFSSAQNLVYLDIRGNRLIGSLASTKWVSLSNLSNLDLSMNLLTGNIPGSLLRLPSLQSVQLFQNELSGQLELNLSSPIETLDLSFNNLEGLIPKSVFQLQGLKVLKLSYNKFNGSVDLSVIQYLHKLTDLDLSFNNLQVYARIMVADIPQLSSLGLAWCSLNVVPTFLERQSNIQLLDLSGNHITGRIPRWIWTRNLISLNLSWNNIVEIDLPLQYPASLKVLTLNSNKIQGVLPMLPQSVFYLDFSNNSFSSIHPTNLENFPKFIVLLSLSRNNISGSIPTSLCNHSQLQVLDLSHNQLNGTIPNCLITASRALAILNLRGNNLSGSFPDTFPEGCSLKTLDANSNFLKGLVPRSLANCKSLEVLDLGNNQFRDMYPQWLNLLQLRVLVLRSNNFYGNIICLENSRWTMLQIVDLASNNFEGTIEGKCLLKWKAMMIGEYTRNISFLNYRFFQYVGFRSYYTDMVSVTSKGSEFHLVKILTIFTIIDLSSNNFNGEIPEEMGNLNSLLVLNLSHNSFSSFIPPSIRNLSNLESLDLSHNQLSGKIPLQLTQLNFLEILNLSYNKLVGAIPMGGQFSTFDASSYEHNQGLCGEPLSISCSDPSTPSKASPVHDRKSSLEARLDWLYILFGSGFGTGAALVIAPVMFWKKGRKRFDKKTDKIVSAFVSACGIVYTTWHEKESQPEDVIGNQLFVITSYQEDDAEAKGKCGRFCVFCTKLDIERKRVIHNPRCNCHGLLSMSSSFSLSTSK